VLTMALFCAMATHVPVFVFVHKNDEYETRSLHLFLLLHASH